MALVTSFSFIRIIFKEGAIWWLSQSIFLGVYFFIFYFFFTCSRSCNDLIQEKVSKLQKIITLERPSVRDITRAPVGGIRGSGTCVSHIVKAQVNPISELICNTEFLQHNQSMNKTNLKNSATSPVAREKLIRQIIHIS